MEQVTTLLLGQDDMRSPSCDATQASGLGSVCLRATITADLAPGFPSQQAECTPGVGISVGQGWKPGSETGGPTVCKMCPQPGEQGAWLQAPLPADPSQPPLMFGPYMYPWEYE